MSNNKELKQYTKKTKTAKEKGLVYQPYSTLNNYIQFAIGDNVQGFIDTDVQNNTTLRNGIVRYGYNNKGKAIKGTDQVEIVIKNAFSEAEIEKIDIEQRRDSIEKQVEEVLYKPIARIKETEYMGKMKEASYSDLWKKTELFFVEQLYKSFSNNKRNNSTITAKDKDLAKIFNIDRSNLSKEMNRVIIGLSQLQIRQYIPHKKIISKNGEKKEQLEDLRLVNLIQDARHENGITEITFNDKFANYIGLCKPLQIPNEIYQLKNLNYDIALYLYGQVRQRIEYKFKIKVKTLYETIRQIKRYEDVTKRNYSREIYQPIEKAFEYLEEQGLLQIDYENTDFITKKNSYDFDKWLHTNLVIKVLKTPNYKELRESRAKHKQLAEKNKEKAIQKNIEKEILKQNRDKINQAVRQIAEQQTIFTDMNNSEAEQ